MWFLEKIPSRLFAILLTPILAACASQVSAGPTLENAEEISIIIAGGGPVSGGRLQVEAGGELQLALARWQCCVFWDEVETNALWSVQPRQGASIDPVSGLLHIDGGTPNGTTYTVTASISGGRQTFESQVTVFNTGDNPLVGVWREVAQIDCDTGQEKLVEEPIEELIFFADGSLTVTWFPFEAYVDYGGTYTAMGGTLVIEPRYVNYLPDNLDGTGNYRIDEQGRLILDKLWLGSRSPQAATGCGHIFTAP